MAQIYLPNYLSESLEIQELLSLPENTNLVTVRIRNYRLLETVLNHQKVVNLIDVICDVIRNFYDSEQAHNITITPVHDHIFVTSKEKILHLMPQLQKALYRADLKAYVSFQLICDQGQIREALPRSVQQLSYSDKVLCYSNNGGCSEIVTNEYKTLNLLQKAIAQETACFAYQPIIDSTDGGIAYHECLMRIPNDKGDMISAGPAIIFAEKYGIIDIIDEAVVDMALKELKASTDLKISINISNIGMLNEKLLAKIIDNFKDRNLASRLIIEITETSDNGDIKKAQDFVDTVRALGIRIALDDFGVGVTSFSQLCAIKFDIIKIDGTFIKDITTNPYHRFITEMVIKFARDIGAKTVAEFVENGKVAKIMGDLGVDFMQGHFFSPAQMSINSNKLVYSPQ